MIKEGWFSVKPEHEPAPTFGVAFVREGVAGPEVLLVEGEHGQWYFPGGKQDPGEDPFETMAREIAEELSVVITPQQLKKAAAYHDTGYYRRIAKGNTKDHVISTVIVRDPAIVSLLDHPVVPPEDSIRQAQWVPLQQLQQEPWKQRLTDNARRLIAFLQEQNTKTS